MDVNAGTIGAAMNCVASLAIQEIAEECGLGLDVAAGRFLASDTARRLFDDDTKLWWDGPATVVDDYLQEVAERSVSG
ncbi:MAG: hypothetical protein J6S63_11185 [Atopobiaceae bacterium]|nr:hypothetical protein [Atopobiaceae bacterium]